MIGHKDFPSRSGGVEVMVGGLARSLVERGYDVTVYNRGLEKHHNVYDVDGVHARRVFTLQKPALNATIYSFLATFDALFRGFDVIHYHAIGPSVPLLIAKLFGKRTVCTVHGLNWKVDKWRGFASRYMKLGERIAAKYAAGIHTNHGMTATLYSFPALMFRNLMKGTVTPRRKGIATVLKKYGYENMFFMTHEAQYDNMKAFFQTNGYDDIFSQENYPKSEVVNSFGVSDHFEMGYALNTINQKAKTGKPFMATILTVSNHPPYVIPDFFKPKTKEKETQIVEYADWAIGDFLKKASREPWYKNTIFVIQADHGKLVGKSEGELPQSYNHIPLIIFGPGVPQQQYVGLGMQVDVMPTLFGLMNLNYEYEGFGVDLLKQQRPMVFYSADNQIVARDHQRCFVYNPSMNRSFCYDVLPNGNLKETKQESKFQDLKNYVFSNIQAAEYIERHQQ